VVKTLNGYKAPSLDGFSLGFFQTFRKVLKKDSMALSREFHGKGRFENIINATFISLIPKTASDVDTKDFRPVSLVGGVYKIISKVLVNMQIETDAREDHLKFAKCVYFFISNQDINKSARRPQVHIKYIREAT
jgi:hypothetical protein